MKNNLKFQQFSLFTCIQTLRSKAQNENLDIKVSHGTIEDFNPLLKPISDTREIKHQTLANGLKVMQIHDPAAPKTCTSLSFFVGSQFNPPQVQGLVHFLEHLMFMNSEKQPQTDFFSTNIDRLNGSYNAYTASMFTNFIFELATQEATELDLVYDIFTSMFIAPVISLENIAKEVNAVDSEFNMHVNDTEFLWDTLATFMQPVGHPLAGFECGNKKTLFDDLSDKEFLKDLIQLFRAKYYSAKEAALVVSSPLPFASLAPTLEAKFSLLPNYDATPKVQAFEQKQAGTLQANYFVSFEHIVAKQENKLPLTQDLVGVEIKSVSKSNRVTIVSQFNLPDTVENATFFKFVYYLFTDPSPGGITHKLREDQQVIKSSFSVDKSQLDQNLFNVIFDITDKQMFDNNYLIQITRVYQEYLRQLLNEKVEVIKKKFDQFKGLSILRQNYSEPSRDMMNNSQIANSILEQGVEHAFDDQVSFKEQDNKLFQYLIQQLLTSKNIVVLKPGNNQDYKFPMKSPNQNAEYQVICPETQSQTQIKYKETMQKTILNCSDSKFKNFYETFKSDSISRQEGNLTANEVLKFDLNNVKSNDMSIDNHQYRNSEQSVEPTVIKPVIPQLTENIMNVQQLQDGQQNLPKTEMTLAINTNILLDLDHQLYATILLGTIHQNLLVHETHLFELGYSIVLQNSVNQVKIRLQGFDQWLSQTFETVMKQVSAQDLELNQVLKQIDLNIERFKNQINQKSFQKATQQFQSLLVKNKHINSEKSIAKLIQLKAQLEKDNDISAILNFREKLFKSVGKTDFLFVGTMPKEKVMGVVKFQTQQVSYSKKKNQSEQQQVKLNKGFTQVTIPNENSFEKQTALIFNQQIDQHKNFHKDIVLAFLLNSKLQNSIFAQLRTKMQIGQVSTFIARRWGDSLNMYGLINGNKYPKDQMIKMQRKWFEEAIRKEKSINAAEFQEMVLNYTTNLKAHFTSLREKSEYIFSHIEGGDLNFLQLAQLVQESEELELNDQVKFVNYLSHNSNMLLLSVQPKTDTDHSLGTVLDQYDQILQKMGYFPKKLINLKDNIRFEQYKYEQQK